MSSSMDLYHSSGACISIHVLAKKNGCLALKISIFKGTWTEVKIDAGFCLPEKSKTYSFTGRIILRSLEGENLRDSQGFHNISLY